MHPKATPSKRSSPRRGARAIAAVLPRVTKACFKKRGFAEGAIVTDWPAIVGPRLAAGCSPEKIVFARGATGGTLVLRVGGALATELQHLEPQLIERINGYFGYPAVARLKLVQGPPPPAPPGPARPRPRELDEGDRRAVAEAVAGVPDGALRAALESLGRAVRRRGSRTPAAGTK